MCPLTLADLNVLNRICDRILTEPGVRFAGVVNKMGNLLAGGFREDIIPFVDPDKEHTMYMQIVLDLRMRTEFDGELGKIRYVQASRDNVNMISVPVGDQIMLLATELEVNSQRLVTLVHQEFAIQKAAPEPQKIFE